MTPAPGPEPQSAFGISRSKTLATLASFVFFLGVAALATWPMVPRAATALPDAGDPAETVWTLHWIAQAALHNPGQLYAAPIFHGFPNPLAYDDTSLLPGLLLAPLWLAPNHLLFYNLLMWVSLALIGFTAYLRLRELLGSEIGGIIGGLVCAVNSYTLAHLSHLSLLSAYLPALALLVLHRLFRPGPRGPHWGLALALALLIVGQLLSTLYILAYLLIAVAAYVAWQGLIRRAVWRWPGAWRRRLVAQLLVVGAITGVAAAIVLAPYVETQQVLGFVRTSQENQAWSARPLDYFSVSLHNRTYARTLPHNEVEPLFAGFTALFLGALGGVSAFRRRKSAGRLTAATEPALAERRDAESGFYALLLLLGVVLTLGPQLDLGSLRIPLPYALLADLPGASALRAPVRAMVLVNLGLAFFAGRGARGLFAGLAYLTALPRRGSAAGGSAIPAARRQAAGGEVVRPVLRGLGLIGLTVLVLLEQQVAPLALTELPATAERIPAVYQWLAAHPDGGALVEFPVGVGLRDPVVESTRMYYQTWHGHPLVNGYSSFRPPTYVEIISRIDAQYNTFSAEQLGILQSLDVHYLLYHEANYKRAAWQQLTKSLKQFPQVHEIGVFESGRFGADHLYTLDPRPTGIALRVACKPRTRAGEAPTVQITNPYSYPLLVRLRPTLDLVTTDGHHLSAETPLTLPPGTQTFPVSGDVPDTFTGVVPLAPAPDSINASSATPDQ